MPEKYQQKLAQNKALEQYNVYRKQYDNNELSDVEKQFIASIEQAGKELKKFEKS